LEVEDPQMMPEDALIDVLPILPLDPASPYGWSSMGHGAMVIEVDLGLVRVRAEEELEQVIPKRPAGLAL
jgi:hypothetical protein